MNVTVIGAGLATGGRLAMAQRGIDVTLREMKPEKRPPPMRRNTSRSCAAPTPGATSWKTLWAF